MSIMHLTNIKEEVKRLKRVLDEGSINQMGEDYTSAKRVFRYLPKSLRESKEGGELLGLLLEVKQELKKYDELLVL